MPHSQFITLTTDFGYEGAFAGVMKGVISGISPQARVIDLSHSISPYHVAEAAFVIGMNYRYFPSGTIHIVVVDPGVGSSRRPLIVSAGQHFFVGPDNGVFSSVYAKEEELHVYEITADHYYLFSHSPTFQGRDLFAPVAAWFSTGIDIAKFGNEISDYVRLALPAPKVTDSGITGEIILIDRFGNAISNITAAEIGSEYSEIRIAVGGRDVPLKPYYSAAAPGQLSALINSSGHLEFFLSRDDAAAECAIRQGEAVTVDFSR